MLNARLIAVLLERSATVTFFAARSSQLRLSIFAFSFADSLSASRTWRAKRIRKFADGQPPIAHHRIDELLKRI